MTRLLVRSWRTWTTNILFKFFFFSTDSTSISKKLSSNLCQDFLPVPVAEFSAYVAHMQEHGGKIFEQEYNVSGQHVPSKQMYSMQVILNLSIF